MFRSIRRSFPTRLFQLACMMLIAAFAPLSAQEYFYIDRYHVDLKLDEDGSYRVSERIVVQFNEPRHGLLRDMPLSYRVDPDDSGVFVDRF
ncbi:MAG TPA: DUF2207 domain-containing protein, partial [Saprospiraceae bacterium]|nr:DUF2207 domain-containing protein [Saprospiraceae bacterium]